MEESRDRFREALDIILEAWKGERFSYQGKYYQVSNVAVHPQPVQKPHPPIWLAAVSPPTAELAGREGFNVLFAQTQSFKNLKEIYDLYMHHWTAAGRDPAAAQTRVARSVYVSETDAEARRVMSAAYDWFLKAQQAVTTPPDGNWELIPESYRHYRENFPKLGRLTYDFIWEQVGLHGPPDRVRERIAMLQREVNLDYLICWMSMGGLDHAKAMVSMERFAREVMPHFADG
jgi:alkanesulfonate monooxygenase SsuD/methylene tetrahydromethanopterin reductase-like flavin-dependent oxidoreductase (luciferase family)